LAIICNVSKIERKPVFEDFDEDNSQAHNKSRERPATLADETEETVVPQTMSSPKLSTGTQDTRDEHEDNDVNLFEESLSLVDREDPGAEVQTELGTNQANSIPQSPEVEPTDAAQATANAKSMPASILSQTTTSSAKNKMRRKSAQPKRDPHQPVILILDSLPGVPRSGTVRALKDWLKAEGLAKRGMDAEIKERGYYPKATQIPTQSNFTDCGVYLLGYVEKFFHNPDEFKNKLLTGSMFAEEDWPELKPEDMRQTMREIIVDLHEKQELERKPKKAKKGMTKSTTSPAPPTQGLTNSESQDTSMERVPPSGPQHGKTQLDHTQRSEAEQSFPHVASQVQPTQPRLASPFEFDRKQAEGYARPFLEIVGKVSDSPPGQTSPIKPASITPRPGRTPKPSSVEVRIPIKIPQSHTSARSEQKTFARTARSQEELRQTRKTPQSLSPSKRQRPNADGAEVPAAKKQSPRRQSRDPNMASSAHNHNGSAPSMPIEIEDSQEAHPTVSRHFQQPQADSQAQRKPPSRSGRPKPSLRHSPSIEEVEGPLPKRKHRKSEEAFPGDALEDKLDEQDYERNRSRRATGPGLPSSLNPTEEADPDSAEEISQSTGRMQLDGANDDAVVRETPEPGRRSPDVQGWSKNDRLFL
jgi:sentrin-specific protease 7